MIPTFLWGTAALLGASLLMLYAHTPGHAAAAPKAWPKESSTLEKEGMPALIMFVHPRCPCSRASLTELERLLAQNRGEMSAHVLFLKPSEVSDDWTQTDLWRRASSIPGVQCRIDHHGAEAKLFHAATSGQVFLYDAQGLLIFQGGITPARGHCGDNAGSDAIATLLGGPPVATTTETPVFGCSLANPEPSPEDSPCNP